MAYVLVGFLLLANASIANLDEDSTVYVNPSSSIFMQISCTPSTGFRWFAMPPNSAKISLHDVIGTYTPPAKNSVGARGIQTFEVICNNICVNEDTEEIILFNSRSWDTITTNIVNFTIIVTIDTDNEIITP